jgi:hypothetical protein
LTSSSGGSSPPCASDGLASVHEMARSRSHARDEPLPPPLPPETRTAGQVVAESIRLYGDRFWRVLPLGLAIALLGQGPFGLPDRVWLGLLASGGAVVVTLAFIAGTCVVHDVRPGRRSFPAALGAGVLVFLPFPLLVTVFVLPGLAWLALLGLSVPAALVERLGLRAALRRGFALGRVDFLHALGSLAALTLAYVLTRVMLILLLRDTGDQAIRVAVFLADLVLSPLMFVGAALLYVDQAARIRARSPNGRPPRPVR